MISSRSFSLDKRLPAYVNKLILAHDYVNDVRRLKELGKDDTILTRMNKIERRTFFKYSLALFAAYILRMLPRWIVEAQRVDRPHLLETVAAESVIFGIAPDKNNQFKGIGKQELGGVQFGLANYFMDPGAPGIDKLDESCKFIGENAELGVLSMISLQCAPEDFIAGSKFEDKLADICAAAEVGLLLRPGYEMNGPWLALGSNRISVQDFISGWRRMFAHFQAKAPNVRFVFSPNISVGAPSFAPWWPGVEYMHATGLDAYAKGLYVPPDLSGEAALGPDMALLQKLAPKLPFILAEVNAINNPRFVADAIRYAAKAGASAVSIFNWNKMWQNTGETDWRIESNPMLKLVLTEMLQDPAFIREVHIIGDTNKKIRVAD